MLIIALLLAPRAALPAADSVKPQAKPNIAILLANHMGSGEKDIHAFGASRRRGASSFVTSSAP
jgi:hypothetical protein